MGISTLEKLLILAGTYGVPLIISVYILPLFHSTVKNMNKVMNEMFETVKDIKQSQLSGSISDEEFKKIAIGLITAYGLTLAYELLQRIEINDIEDRLESNIIPEITTRSSLEIINCIKIVDNITTNNNKIQLRNILNEKSKTLLQSIFDLFREEIKKPSDLHKDLKEKVTRKIIEFKTDVITKIEETF